jgi:monooxygenase
VPDGDLLACLSSGKASVVTDKIVRLTPNGIHLASGDELDADVITTATGLRMLPYGGIELSVDEVPVDLHNSLACRWPIPLDSVHRPR